MKPRVMRTVAPTRAPIPWPERREDHGLRVVPMPVRDPGTPAVITGRLHAVEGYTIVLGGSIRITLLPGVKVPDVPIGTSLTIVLVRRDRRTFAESIRAIAPLAADSHYAPAR